jgi:hypothetical protein
MRVAQLCLWKGGLRDFRRESDSPAPKGKQRVKGESAPSASPTWGTKPEIYFAGLEESHFGTNVDSNVNMSGNEIPENNALRSKTPYC